MSKNLRKLTDGERFWIARTTNDLTQAEIAQRMKISERHYLQLEKDRRNSYQPPTLPERPTPGQLCALARRRDGRPLRTLAKLLGAGSHVTLLTWERTSDPRLVKAWRRLGYRF
jgi:transcriptional regulator with XRE-family HTH domain